ncbi:MAG: thioredoxin family protein [Bacteroidota bacterium]
MKTFFFSILLLCSLPSIGQLQHYPFEAVDSLWQVEKRPLVVFLHTDWCRYCEAMRQKTLQNEDIIDLLNEEFYYLPFDAESEEEIRFRGHPFSFEPTGRGTGIHSLAKALGTIDGEIAYPTLVVLNEDYEIVFQYAGFMNARAMRRILQQL